MYENAVGPIVTAGSLVMAVRIVAANPHFRASETQRRRGMYDCLTVVGLHVQIDVNRARSIHVQHARGKALVVAVSSARQRLSRRGSSPGAPPPTALIR